MGHMIHASHFHPNHLAVFLIVLVLLVLLSKIGVFKLIGGVIHFFFSLFVLLLVFLALKFMLFGVAVGTIGGFLVFLIVVGLLLG